MFPFKIDWPRFSFWTWLVAILLALFLLLTWLFGHGSSSCSASTSAITGQNKTATPTTAATSIIESNVTVVATDVSEVACSDRMAISVTFDNASASISSNSQAILDAVAKCLEGNNYKIAGYTDSVGSEESNNKLSLQRAMSAKEYLITKGVSGDSLSTEGMGEQNPIASNDTPEGRAQNRRIEFIKE